MRFLFFCFKGCNQKLMIEYTKNKRVGGLDAKKKAMLLHAQPLWVCKTGAILYSCWCWVVYGVCNPKVYSYNVSGNCVNCSRCVFYD